jgi:Tol biopolymer transport system component
VFSSTVGAANGGIHTVNADGSGLALLVSTEFEEPGAGDWLGMPAWSPDGSTIAFVRTNYYKPWQTYVVNADGSGPRVLSSSHAQNPSWSPDGSMIAFGAFQNIGSMRADGTGYQIYETMGSAFDPDWSPDGRSLIFSMPQEGRARIHVLDLKSGAVRQLIPEAVAPAAAEYRDDQAAWRRAGGLGEWDYGRRSPP